MCDIDKYEEHKNDGRKGCVISCIGLILLAFAVIIMMLTACKTTYVPIETVRTDTVRITRQQHDSIYVHDSIYQKENGDTLLIERWHTRYKEKLVHDTIYQHRIDSVPKPYPVPEYIEKKLNWWQRLRMRMGEIAMIFLIAAAGIGIWKLKKRFWPL